MVINIKFIYHFVDPDLTVEIFFEKKGAVENGDVDFQIRDIGTSTHMYWKLKQSNAGLVCFFIVFFFVTKNSF